jgi:S1-C subfamily serine protease
MAYAQIDFISNAIKINCNGSQGAGFWIEDRIIVTAKHVVEKCSTANIANNDGVTQLVSQIVLSTKFDIAYLLIGQNSALARSPFISKNPPQLGETIYAVGAPIDGLVLSKGKLVGKFKNELGDWIEIDIPADHGNSGGPVFSDVGIVGMLISKDISNQSINAYSIDFISRDLLVSKRNFDLGSDKPRISEISSKSPLLTQVISGTIFFVFGLLLGIALGLNRVKGRHVKKKRIKIYV